MTELQALNMLEQAVSSTLGLKVSSSNADALRRKLYAVKAKRVRFDLLTLRISPDDGNTLFIIKRRPTDAQP